MKKIYSNAIQLAAPLALVIAAALLYAGCLGGDRKPPVDVSPLAAYDDAGVARAIRARFGTTLGQIISVENHTAGVASAVVSVTSPRPDMAKVWLVKDNGVWYVDRVVRQYDDGDGDEEHPVARALRHGEPDPADDRE